MERERYERAMEHLKVELAKLEYWVRSEKARVVVLFEGRDAAGKGGAIDAIRTGMNPRTVRTVALQAPTEAERTSWYFQRYVSHLPRGGEIVLFDRSWYNRAGVEPVMGFCTPEQHERFLEDCPVFEEMLLNDGVILRKFYLSVSQAEQHKRFEARAKDTTKRWKISDVDLAAVDRFDEYTRAKEEMFRRTHTERSPWLVVDSNDKRAGRLDLIEYLLKSIPYGESEPPAKEVPEIKPELKEKKREIAAGYAIKVPRSDLRSGGERNA